MNNSTNFSSGGLLITCSDEWDSKNSEFKNANFSDISKCCLNECLKKVDNCREYCNNKFSDPILNSEEYDICHSKCDLQRKSCLSICPSTDLHNYYSNCLNLYGCINYENNQVNLECLNYNKDLILNCCKQTCSPFSNIQDCGEYCNFIQDIILTSSDYTDLYQKKLKSVFNNSTFDESKNNNIFNNNILLIGLIIGLFFCIWIYLKYIKK